MPHGPNRRDRRDRQHWARMGSRDKSKWGAFESQESIGELTQFGSTQVEQRPVLCPSDDRAIQSADRIVIQPADYCPMGVVDRFHAIDLSSRHRQFECTRKPRPGPGPARRTGRSKWDMSLRPGVTNPFQVGGVDTVHTFGFRPGSRWVGSGRIPHVSAASQCLQARECSSSPTSGTTFSLVRGDFALTCVQSLWSRRSDGLGRGLWPGRRGACSGVWGGGFKTLAGGPSSCCGWVLAVPRAGFVGLVVGGQHLFMVPGDGYDMTTPTLVRLCCKSVFYLPLRR